MFAPRAIASLARRPARGVSFSSPRLLRTRQELAEIVIDAGHVEVRLPTERVSDVAHAVAVAVELDDGEDEVLGAC